MRKRVKHASNIYLRVKPRTRGLQSSILPHRNTAVSCKHNKSATGAGISCCSCITTRKPETFGAAFLVGLSPHVVTQWLPVAQCCPCFTAGCLAEISQIVIVRLIKLCHYKAMQC